MYIYTRTISPRQNNFEFWRRCVAAQETGVDDKKFKSIKLWKESSCHPQWTLFDFKGAVFPILTFNFGANKVQVDKGTVGS